MTIDDKEYLDFVLGLEQDYTEVDKFLEIPENKSMLYAYIGLTTEVGELGELIKRMIFRPESEHPTREEVAEETGDILFFLVLLLFKKYKLTMTDSMQANIAKLKKRYPDGKFSLERYIRSGRDKLSENLAIANTLKECAKGVDNEEV